MSAELTFRDVSYPGFFERFSCSIAAGSSALFVTSREAEGTMLTRLLSGLSAPSHGSVIVNDQDVAKLSPEELQQFRQQLAVVPAHGGLISNLKVWENITLPLLYHSDTVTDEQEQAAGNYLTALGYSGNLMALPAHLSLQDKRAVALVRAWLKNPTMIVYSNCFDAAPSPERAHLSRLAAEFHTTRNDRISLYLASSADLASELNVDAIFHVHVAGENVSRNT